MIFLSSILISEELMFEFEGILMETVTGKPSVTLDDITQYAITADSHEDTDYNSSFLTH